MSFPAAVALRLVLSAALVLATYNPTGHSWTHMARETWPHINGLFALGTVILTIAWVVLARATHRALGIVGWVLLAALLGCLAWVAYDAGWVDLKNRTVGTWAVLIGIIVVHTVGLSWRDLRRRTYAPESAPPAPAPK